MKQKRRRLKLKKILITAIVLLLLLGSFIKYLTYLPLPKINNGENIVNLVDIHNPTVNIDHQAHLLINLDTNQILHEYNSSEALPVYSMSKSMLIYTSLIELEKQNRSLDEIITVDASIDLINQNHMFSTANMTYNQNYTLRELIEATLIVSGNDSALQLAISVFNSHELAVKAMNETAQDLGFSNSNFVTVNGLDGELMSSVGIEAEPGKNVMSAIEVFKLLQIISEQFPELFEITKQSQISFGKYTDNVQTLTNTNSLISGQYYLPDVIGFKTGSNALPYSYALSSVRQGQSNLAAIVIGAQSRDELYLGMHQLYDFADNLKVANLQEQVEMQIPVRYASNDIMLKLKDPFYIYYDDIMQIPLQLVDINKKFLNQRTNQFINIENDTVIGQLKINASDAFIETEVDLNTDLIIANEIIEKSFLQKVQETISTFFKKVMR